MRPSEDTERVLAELAQLPIAAAIGPDHLARLARIGAVESLAGAACLFRAGDPAEDLRVVVSGRVSLTLEAPGKPPVIVASLSRGDLLGWSALRWSSTSAALSPSGATWTASAVASKPTTCLRFPGAQLRELCELDHELGYHVMRHAFEVVSRRLQDCRVQLLDVYGDGR